MVRTVIIGTIALGIGFYVGNALAPLMTEVAPTAGFELPEDAAMITSIADGFIWVPWLFSALAQLAGVVGLVIILALVVLGYFFYSRSPEAWERAAGGHAEEMAAPGMGAAD